MILRLNIGPYVITLNGDVLPQFGEKSSFSSFCDGESVPANLLIRLHEGFPDPLDGSQLAAELPRNWRVFRQGEGWRFELLDPARFHLKQVANLSFDFCSADFYFGTGRKLLSEMTPFLQWWLTALGGMRGQALFAHSASCVLQGMGFGFAGPSGAGKTTLALLCRKHGGALLLNDERSILWQNQGGVHVSGTPWPGKAQEASVQSAPLGGLFFVKKGEQNRWVPLLKKEILHRLTPELFLPFWNPGAMDGLFEFCERLIQRVPVMEFQFRNDASAVEFLGEFVEEAGGGKRWKAA